MRLMAGVYMLGSPPEIWSKMIQPDRLFQVPKCWILIAQRFCRPPVVALNRRAVLLYESIPQPCSLLNLLLCKRIQAGPRQVSLVLYDGLIRLSLSS